MHHKIDWLSFTIQIDVEPVSPQQLELKALFKISALGDTINEYVFDGSRFDFVTGRAPYRFCLERDDHGVRIYGGSNTGTILVECTGRFFDRLNDWREIQALIEPVAERATRLDVATDIHTNVSPDSFVSGGYSPRFKSSGRMESETGITCYVGSAKSDCFARVYRYSYPHPRSALLRVEVVARRDIARSACRAILACRDITEFVTASNARFAWGHGLWDTSTTTDVLISAPVSSRESAGTIFWLYKQVAPAIRKLMASGEFDLTEWLLYLQGEGENPFEG